MTTRIDHRFPNNLGTGIMSVWRWIAIAMIALVTDACGLLLPRTPDVGVISMTPNDRGAYVIVSSNLDLTVRNLQLDCRFKLSNGALEKRHVAIQELPARARIEITSDPKGTDKRDQRASCKPVKGTETSPPVPVGYAPISVE